MSPLLPWTRKEAPAAGATPAPGNGAVEGGTDGGEPGRTKGRPTPKRPRQSPPPPPPRTRKEAYARTRAMQRDQRGRSRAGLAAGDDAYAMPRDRGPVRRLVRDIVDARRNIGSWFLVVGLLIIAGNGSRVPAVQLAATMLWLLLLLGLAADWTLLGRRIARLVRERYPDDATRMRSHVFYGIMRSTQFRRLRMPRPQVRIGERV